MLQLYKRGNMDIQIIDDFLDKDSFENIKNTMLSENFPWFYVPRKTNGYDFNENFQFVHIFYIRHSINSNHSQILNPLIDKIDALALVKIKANLTVKTKEIIDYGYHTDYITDSKLYTAVYYINSNNGSTNFENGPSVKSKENRIVIFDSQLRHSGTSCTDERLRVLINLNFYKNPSN